MSLGEEQQIMNTTSSTFIPKYTSMDQINQNFNLLYFLDRKTEHLRTLISDYMSVPGTPLNIKKRVILLSWMQDFCATNGFKRDTFHSASILVDVYMSKVKVIDMNKYQLLGATAMLIAMKNEEVEFLPIDHFSSSTAGACSSEDIRDFEKQMIKTLSWKVQYPNLAYWANLITKEWDTFVLDNPNLRDSFHLFRNDAQLGYSLFKNLFLFLDVMTLDYIHLKYNEKKLCLSLCYLLLGLSLQCFSLDNILHGLSNIQPNGSFYTFNTVFNFFIKLRFNLELDDLRNEIEYSVLFFDIYYDYNESHFAARAETEEERLQLQTKNKHFIESIKKVWDRREAINENPFQPN